MSHTYSDDRPATRNSSWGFDTEPPPAWQADALCAQTDPEIFFPEKGGTTTDARRICALCDVRDECLEYALDNDERYGVWGGASERERRAMNASRPRAPKSAQCRYCRDDMVLITRYGPERKYCSQRCREAAATARREAA